jgi:hypothetical protein
MTRTLGFAALAILALATVSPAMAGGNGNQFKPFQADALCSVTAQWGDNVSASGTGRGGENGPNSR